MEGLSIEEKAKRYDKAIKQLRTMMPNWENLSYNGKTFLQDLVHIIPELREESEDERIRKAIGYAIGQSTHSDGILINGVSSEEALSWLEKQGKNNMGISEATKQKLEDNLNNALEKETPESCNEFLDEQSCKEENLKERNICDTCEDSNGCLIPCCAKLLEKQGEQKPVFEMKTPEESLGIDSETYNKIVDECVYGENKSAWSEEDKDILFRTINDLKFLRDTISIDPKYAVNIIDTEREINWLKSLKERYTWKPSDGQMLAINTAINVLGKGTINGKYLIELHEQLKKLREE